VSENSKPINSKPLNPKSAKDPVDLVALIGAPNCGKTTLYNWLTNSKFKTVNYPGATVEYAIGNAADRLGHPFLFMDTPGTYSLFPKSSDEEVTLRALFEKPQGKSVEKVICVVDGSQLERHLLTVQQIKESGFSFLIVVTMSDLLKKNKMILQKKILEEKFQAPVVQFDGRLGGGLQNIVDELKKLDSKIPIRLQPWSDSDLEKKTTWMREWAALCYNQESLKKVYEPTARADRWLLHPFLGLIFFFLIMSVLFSSIFWLAKPFMDLVDFSFSWLAGSVMNLAPHSLWTDFLGHGLVASFGAVAVFAPQIFILFFGIGLLESSGYLARAATLIDRPFSSLGMSGRSFVPILSGFACAVPAMMATRNISSKRDRLITNFIIPLMTCSARLPVYALLLSLLFKESPAWVPGIVLSLLYMCSLFIGGIAAAILNRILPRAEHSLFMMELPLYRLPRIKVLLQQCVSRTRGYLFKAGPVIFVFAVLIWAGTTFPHYQAETAHEKMQDSYFARAGHFVEPVFEPMGVDWRVGVGLMSAFAAREVFVSSLAIVFNVTEENEGAQSKSLLKAMEDAKTPSGRPIFTLASCLGLIVFFMIALQCMSTFSVSIRENGSVRIAVLQLVVFNIVAYLLAVGLVQSLHWMGVGT
jgi:ferrous iron transport protein B